MRLYLAIYVVLLLLLAPASQAQPDKIWATYFGDKGGSWVDVEISNVLFSPDGSLYVTGVNWDSTVHLASPGSFLPEFGTYSLMNAYLARFDQSGNLLWCTYIHNGDMTIASLFGRITLDEDGQVLIAGQMNNSNAGVYVNHLGTPGTYCPEIPLYARGPGVRNNYLLKFDSMGQRLWGTYLDHYDLSDTTSFYPSTICTDPDNNIIVAARGSTSGFSFPPGSYMPDLNSDTLITSAVLMKFSPAGQLQWGTYLTPYGLVFPHQLACNSSGDIYLAGLTNIVATDGTIATPGAFYPQSVITDPLMENETFLTRFNASGQRIWGTYTNGLERTGGMVVDDNGDIYLLNTTRRDTGIATPGTHQQLFGGQTDMALTKWNASGSKIWGTYYGGDFVESVSYDAADPNNPSDPLPERNVLSMDDEGRLLIAGRTTSNTGIQVGCTYTPGPNTPGNGFIARFYPDGNIMWGSYYDMPINSVSCGTGSDFYIVSATDVDGLATPGTHQTSKTPNTFAGFLSLMNKNYECPMRDENMSAADSLLSMSDDYPEYQWYYNGSPIDGATGNSHIATDTGAYYVGFKDSCNCIYTTDTLLFPGPTGLQQQEAKPFNIQLYPNPAYTTLYLSGTLPPRASRVNVTCFDMMGRKIAEHTVSATRGQLGMSLSVSHLAAGLYRLRISVDGATQQLTFVKQQG